MAKWAWAALQTRSLEKQNSALLFFNILKSWICEACADFMNGQRSTRRTRMNFANFFTRPISNSSVSSSSALSASWKWRYTVHSERFLVCMRVESKKMIRITSRVPLNSSACSTSICRMQLPSWLAFR